MSMKLSKHIELVINLLLYQKYYFRTKRLLNSKSFNTKENIERYQLKKLKDIIEYSNKYVPYYYDLFNRINFRPDDFKSIKDIKRIPYLTKDIIRNNQEKLISRVFPKKFIKTVQTGGTTGVPLDFFLDKRTSSVIEMAYLEDMWKRVNYRIYNKCVVLREDNIENIIEGQKYWKMNFTTNWLTMSARHLNTDTFRIFYNKIISFNPHFIIAFPSNAYLLARLIKENNLRNFPRLKAVICSSENMYDWQRKYMEEIFKVRIYSYYAHSEKCIIASECKNSSMYEFYPQYGFVELINRDNNWCTEENEKGEIIATGFNNFVSPFLRYKTDDVGIYTTLRCENNLNWYTLKRIEGRTQDFLIDRDNTPKTSIHIDRPFWNIRDQIYAYQYIQDNPGEVLLKIHAKEKLNSKQLDDIKKVFLKTYFKIDIKIEQVHYISRTKSGKFRYLLQNIKNIIKTE